MIKLGLKRFWSSYAKILDTVKILLVLQPNRYVTNAYLNRENKLASLTLVGPLNAKVLSLV